MNKKRLVLSAAAFTVALALVSCRSLSACAVEIGVSEQTGIYDYLDTYGENLADVDFQFSEDEDGNRNIRLKIFALQKLALEEQTRIYDLMDFEAAPSYISVSGSGGAGLYESALDHQIHSVTVTPFSGQGSSGSVSWASSDEFTVYFTWSNRYDVNLTFEPYTSGRYCGGHLASWNSGSSFGVSQAGGYFTSLYTDNDPYASTFSLGVSAGNVEVLARDFNWYSVIHGNSQYIGWAGDVVEIPPADDVPTESPWDYYNNDLLPYIWDEFGHDYDDILVFPFGYEPPAQPSTVPVVYPTLPGYDFGLVEDGTLPSDTSAYVLPELPTKEIAVPAFDFSALNPAEIMAPVSGGLAGIWSLITDVLTEYNLFPYVGIAIFCAIVAACMTLGR